VLIIHDSIEWRLMIIDWWLMIIGYHYDEDEDEDEDEDWCFDNEGLFIVFMMLMFFDQGDRNDGNHWLWGPQLVLLPPWELWCDKGVAICDRRARQIQVHCTISSEIVPLHVAMVLELLLERWGHHAIRHFDYGTDWNQMEYLHGMIHVKPHVLQSGSLSTLESRVKSLLRPRMVPASFCVSCIRTWFVKS